MRTSWMPLLLMCASGAAARAQESRRAESQDVLALRLRNEPAATHEKLKREGKAAVPRLMRLVAEGSMSECLHALDALANLGSQAQEGVPELLETAAEIVQHNAARPPGRVKTPEERVLEAVENREPLAQVFMQTPETAHTMEDEAQALEAHLIHALSRMGAKALKPMVNDLLGTDRHKRAFAIRTVGAMGREGSAAVRPLRYVLRNADREERMRIVDTLGCIGAGATPAIVDLVPDLEGGDPELRMTAARALWGIGRPAIPALVTSYGSAGVECRRAIAWALAAIARTEEQAAWVLPRLLRDEDEIVRRSAIEGLRSVRVLTAEVRTTLRDLAARDPSYQVRLNAEVTVLLRERTETADH